MNHPSVDWLEGEKKSDQYVPKMCLLGKITYGEFSEFVREKKLHIMYIYGFIKINRWCFQFSSKDFKVSKVL